MRLAAVGFQRSAGGLKPAFNDICWAGDLCKLLQCATSRHISHDCCRDAQHDKHTGAIIPGRLYGYGIAFPEEVTDPEYGHKESNVGLWKFMRYAREVLPAQQLCAAPA